MQTSTPWLSCNLCEREAGDPYAKKSSRAMLPYDLHLEWMVDGDGGELMFMITTSGIKEDFKAYRHHHCVALWGPRVLLRLSLRRHLSRLVFTKCSGVEEVSITDGVRKLCAGSCKVYESHHRLSFGSWYRCFDVSGFEYVSNQTEIVGYSVRQLRCHGFYY